MKVAIRFIYFKAAASPIHTIDMCDDDWYPFLNGSDSERKKIACKLLNKENLCNHIRVLSWIPLGDSYEVVNKQIDV
jgi:hypothetical protein